MKRLPLIAIGAAMILGVFSYAQADTQITIPITDASTGAMQTVPTGQNQTGSATFTSYNRYFGAYPDTSTLLGSIGPGTTNFSAIDGFQWGPVALGDGPYWGVFVIGGISYYHQLNRLSGVWSSGILPNFNTTGWFQPYYPTNNALSTSTSVYFSADFFFNTSTSFGLIDKAAFEITDVSLGSTASTFGITTINTGGRQNLHSNATLISGHLYLWRPVLYSSAGTSTPIYGDFSSLDVVTRSASSTPFLGATVGTSTLPDATNLLSFLNVTTLLQTKAPFGYFFQAKDAIIAGVNGSTTTSIPTGTFSVHGIGSGTTTVDMFSTSTIAYFLSPTLVTLLRGLMVAVLYFEFIYLLYMRGKSQHLI